MRTPRRARCIGSPWYATIASTTLCRLVICLSRLGCRLWRCLIDRCARLGEQVDCEQRREHDEEAGENRRNGRKEAIRPSAPATPTAVYAPATADAGEEIEQSGSDQQVAASDQTRAEGEHSEQERDSSRGRTG